MAPTRKVLIEKINPLYKRWESSGFLDGLNGHVKNNIAQLYESQASCIIDESLFQPQTIGVSSRGFGEKSKTVIGNYRLPNINEIKKQSIISKIKYFFISIWQKIFKKKKKKEEGFPSLLPLAMKVSARTVVSDLVRVEPMGLPTGMLFYLDLKEQEREDVYTSKVIVEKYAPKKLRYNIMNRDEDFFIPLRPEL